MVVGGSAPTTIGQQPPPHIGTP